MSSTVSEAPLALEIRPSLLLAYFIIGVHAVAGMVVILLPASLWVLIMLLCVLILSCVKSYQTHAGLGGCYAVVCIRRRTDGTWQLRQADGVLHQARLMPDSYLHRNLLVLNFRLNSGKRRRVVLARDSADLNSLRCMRVALMLMASGLMR